MQLGISITETVGFKEKNIYFSADDIFISAHKCESTLDLSGIGIVDKNWRYESNTNMVSNGKNGININADVIGYLSIGKKDTSLIAKDGSININGGKSGLTAIYPGQHIVEDFYCKTKLQANKDINIYGKDAGIETVYLIGNMGLSSGGNICIISENKD